ncbi:hypothetical protein OG266_00610 [Streptomyces sp. NBC_00554]|uniref:hypothetical protein n=1 Tax=Streptomyces sp. NBC_00554 TaxID=2903661 RepID=UPI00352E0B8D|nr:hypothetical protein OG266_00610 [Streptomyces sp. NBC_00554]
MSGADGAAVLGEVVELDATASASASGVTGNRDHASRSASSRTANPAIRDSSSSTRP